VSAAPDPRDLLLARALGTATPEEDALLDAALARDPALAAELAAVRETLGLLDAAVAPVAPPADLADRVLARVAGEAERPRAEHVVPRRRRRRLAVPALAATLAAVAASALTYVALRNGDDDGAPDATATVAASSGEALGEARLYRTDGPDGRLVLSLHDLPAAPAGHHYEVWVLREGADHMEPVASVGPAGGTVRLEVPLPGAGAYAATDISLEDDGGPPEHSGTSVAGGAFGPARS
jgi:anti-sigma-K factor RskA